MAEKKKPHTKASFTNDITKSVCWIAFSSCHRKSIGMPNSLEISDIDKSFVHPVTILAASF